MSLYCLFILLLIFPSYKSDDEFPFINNILENPNLLQFILPALLESYQQQLIGSYDEILTNFTQKNNSTCSQHLKFLSDSVMNGEEWALKMCDSWAKPQTGLFIGNIMHIGAFDECVSIKANKENEEIGGMYCSVPLYPHNKYAGDVINNLPFWPEENSNDVSGNQRTSFAFCFPDACTHETLQDMFDYFEDSVESQIHFKVDPQFCSTDKPKAYTTSAIIGLTVFIFFIIIAILSTLYDVFIYNEDTGIEVLKAFSISTNLKKILSTKSPQDNLGCLNGMRVISMMWVLLGHKYISSLLIPQVNMIDVLILKDSYRNFLVMSAPMAVETFFVISGLLLTYTFLKGRDKGLPFSFSMFFVHRILRLTPALVMVIVFYLTWFSYIGDGPYWPAVREYFQVPCEKWWWSTLLYVQNYVNADNTCVGQSWYLAVDTQLYFLSPLFLFPLVKWPKRTIAAFCVVISLSAAYAFEVTVRKQFSNIIFNNPPEEYIYLYSPTHVRFVTYLIGVISGYIIYNTKKSGKVRICSKLNLILWTFALSICLCIMIAHVASAKYEYNAIRSAFFNAFARSVWAIAVSVMIFLCVHGYGGIINSVLCCPIFTILIRINYSMYLVHTFVLFYFIAQQRVSPYYMNKSMIHSFWGDLVMVILVALVWTLMFESPVIALEKVIFKRAHKPIRAGANNNGTLPVYARSENLSRRF